MWLATTMFGIPLLIGIVLGFCSKSYLNKVIRKRAFDKHMDMIFKEYEERKAVYKENRHE